MATSLDEAYRQTKRRLEHLWLEHRDSDFADEIIGTLECYFKD